MSHASRISAEPALAKKALPSRAGARSSSESSGKSPERKVNVLRPDHASGVYSDLHRTRVLVLAFTAVLVRRDPSRDPPVRRAALTLEQFVAYKGTYGLIRGNSSVDESFDRFKAWRAQADCTGERDPRVLPLHVFDGDTVDLDLNTSAGAAAFRRQFGPPRRRIDAGRKIWTRAERRAYHGFVELEVAGVGFTPGMHWDVGSTRQARLLTSHQVWKLRGKRSYLNVYPNEYVRAGRDAMRVWPKSA